MKHRIRFQWVSLFKVAMIASFSMVVLSACKGDNDNSPSAPANPTPAPTSAPTEINAECEFAETCPRGGWVKVCMNSDMSLFILMSDGKKFSEAQVDEAESYCANKL